MNRSESNAVNETNVPPNTTPLVTVAFSGLIVLRPGANNTCQIGVHRFCRDHQFQVILVVNKPNRPPILVPLLIGPLTSSFSIRLDPDPGVGDFAVFARNPFDRTRQNSHDLDYRWTINFKDLHMNAQVNGGVEPMGTLHTGVLYTPHLTDPILAPRLRRPNSPDFMLNHLASSLAASIDPPANTNLVLEWQDMGDPVELTLKRPQDPAGTLYTLYFINDPPNINAEVHDEFSRYYKVIESGGGPIPGQQRFELRFAGVVRTDEIPCMPGILNP